ncbi:MAG: C39 family peptidase [Kiloniellales bacterium]
MLLLWSPAFAGDRGPVKSLLEMRHEQVVIQQWDLSCGAAALATVLRYQHEDPVLERDVAKRLMRRSEYLANPLLVRARHGFSFNDLKDYVDARGYEGIGYGNLSIADLVEFAPVIVPVRFYGYNHFVVFRGLRAGRVLLADPAWGNRTLSLGKFSDAWLAYGDIGKVGFVVARADGKQMANRMAPRDEDFMLLR